MASTEKNRNPFYVLLVIAGVAFLISACAYGVMTVRDSTLGAAGEPKEITGILGFMDEYGIVLLGIEILLLGLFTLAAIGTDEFWQRKKMQKEANINEKTELLKTEENRTHEG